MPLRELCVHVDLYGPFRHLLNDHVIALIVFAIFIKLPYDGFMFPSFRNNDLLSYICILHMSLHSE